MIVNIFNEQTALKISPEQVERLVQQVLNEEKEGCDEVNIYFVDTPSICELHDEFFDDPSPTDCISFPMDEEPLEEGHYRILGEVFVCPETAITYAAEQAGDPYKETTLYLVHGLLHLLGFDDQEEEEIKEMREAEKRHMTKLYALQLQLEI